MPSIKLIIWYMTLTLCWRRRSVKRRLTPQEKKRLSYERDRRNAYGENDKSSRKSIRLRKRMRARTERKRASQGLAPGTIPVQLDDGDHLDAELLPARDPRPWFRKWPDRPLGEHVNKKLTHLARLRDDAAVETRDSTTPD